jgi:chemotaxis protein methyltransferase CheR
VARDAADLILLRNVLIYFDLATKQTVLRHAKKVLRSDGYLFLGGAETTLNIDAGYSRETVGDSVCYRPRG